MSNLCACSAVSKWVKGQSAWEKQRDMNTCAPERVYYQEVEFNICIRGQISAQGIVHNVHVFCYSNLCSVKLK